ncbi:hypothetical protein D3C77_461330 [compost metagenome]
MSLEVVYPAWYQIAGFAKNLLYGVGVAIFITIFISSKLQQALHEEKKKELEALTSAVNNNVFDGLFKVVIPEEIFDVIKREIIGNKALRREAKWIFEFSACEGGILCRQTTSYELHNLSSEEIKDPVSLELDSLGGEKYEVISAECHDKTGGRLAGYYGVDDPDNSNVNVRPMDCGNTVVDYLVKIPAESHVVYKTIYNRIYGGDLVDAQATKVPLVGVDIIVSFPLGYDFGIHPLMSNAPKLISEGATQKIWRVSGGLLPNQSIVFYLNKL